MKKPLLVVLCFWIILSTGHLAAQAPDKVASGLRAILDQPIYKHAHWGLLVVDRQTGEPVYELNADRLFIPASTTKLFSVATALDEEGRSAPANASRN